MLVEAFRIVCLGAVAVLVCVFGKAVFALAATPLSLLVLPGQLLAGNEKNWTQARLRFVLGITISACSLLLAGSALIALEIGFTFYLQTLWSDFPSWLLWLLSLIITVGGFYQFARAVSLEQTENYQSDFPAIVISWNLLWVLSPVLFGVLALRPIVVHSYFEWVPYIQYCPGEHEVEKGYLASIRTLSSQASRKVGLSALDQKQMQLLAQQDPVKARTELLKSLSSAQSGEEFLISGLKSLKAPRRLQDFHSAFIRFNERMLQLTQSATASFRQRDDYAVFASTMEQVASLPELKEMELAARAADYKGADEILGP